MGFLFGIGLFTRETCTVFEILILRYLFTRSGFLNLSVVLGGKTTRFVVDFRLLSYIWGVNAFKQICTDRTYCTDYCNIMLYFIECTIMMFWHSGFIHFPLLRVYKTFEYWILRCDRNTKHITMFIYQARNISFMLFIVCFVFLTLIYVVLLCLSTLHLH